MGLCELQTMVARQRPRPASVSGAVASPQSSAQSNAMFGLNRVFKHTRLAALNHHLKAVVLFDHASGSMRSPPRSSPRSPGHLPRGFDLSRVKRKAPEGPSTGAFSKANMDRGSAGYAVTSRALPNLLAKLASVNLVSVDRSECPPKC